MLFLVFFAQLIVISGVRMHLPFKDVQLVNLMSHQLYILMIKTLNLLIYAISYRIVYIYRFENFLEHS